MFDILATAQVHNAYLRLVNVEELERKPRGHNSTFCGVRRVKAAKSASSGHP